MKQNDVISINPGVKTLGELCIEGERFAAVSRTIAPINNSNISVSAVAKTLLGVGRFTKTAAEIKMAGMRICFGVAIFLLYFSDIISAISTSASIFSMGWMAAIVSMSLIFGVFSRIASFSACVIWSFLAIQSAVIGNLDITSILSSVLAGCGTIAGASKMSVDTVIYQIIRKRRAKARRAETEMWSNHANSYRAYELADQRFRL